MAGPLRTAFAAVVASAAVACCLYLFLVPDGGKKRDGAASPANCSACARCGVYPESESEVGTFCRDGCSQCGLCELFWVDDCKYCEGGEDKCHELCLYGRKACQTCKLAGCEF